MRNKEVGQDPTVVRLHTLYWSQIGKKKYVFRYLHSLILDLDLDDHVTPFYNDYYFRFTFIFGNFNLLVMHWYLVKTSIYNRSIIDDDSYKNGLWILWQYSDNNVEKRRMTDCDWVSGQNTGAIMNSRGLEWRSIPSYLPDLYHSSPNDIPRHENIIKPQLRS